MTINLVCMCNTYECMLHIYIYIYKAIGKFAISSTAANRIVTRLYRLTW